MRPTRFSEIEIIYAVKQVEMGISVKEIARKYGVCENTLRRWRRKHDGSSPSELKRLLEGSGVELAARRVLQTFTSDLPFATWPLSIRDGKELLERGL
jgi:putative transposase